MVCTRCGASNPAGAVFCGGCGQSLVPMERPAATFNPMGQVSPAAPSAQTAPSAPVDGQPMRVTFFEAAQSPSDMGMPVPPEGRAAMEDAPTLRATPEPAPSPRPAQSAGEMFNF